MLELLTTHQFERDFIRQLKSGKDKKKFLEIIKGNRDSACNSA
jgi:mRNA-degrading endonuclease YafQ of YafQ-DinJ toxin-antitoxin module